jgi:tryptophan-rich sensory protein
MVPVEWLAFFTFFAVTFTFGSPVDQTWVEERRKRVRYVLPILLFQFFQLVAYALLFVAVFLYWKDDFDKGAYDAFFSIFFVIILLDKIWLWTHLLFSAIGGILAILFVILMLVGLGFLIAFAAVAENWTTFAFLIVYAVWVLYLVVISIQFHRGTKRIREEAPEAQGYRGMGENPR